MTLDSVAVQLFGEPPHTIEDLPHATRTTATRRVCRVHTTSGAAIVKVIARDPGRGPDDPYSGEREPAVYEHGLPPAFVDAGIAIPALLHLSRTAGTTTLWLEQATGDSGDALTPRHYERVARRLGRAQGALVDHALPDGVPWSRDFLAAYLATWDDVGWERVYDDAAWAQPLVREHFPPALRRDLVALCEQRREILGWADRLPQTLCHHDVWLNNVFDRDENSTLIDWAFTGTGALGADAGNLVTDSCGDLLLPSSLLPELDAAATDGYRDGLREAGWTGDFALARLGMCVLAAKWSWLTPHMLRLAARDSHAVYGRGEVDSHTLFAERAAMLRFHTALAAEARARAERLGW